MKTQTIAFIVSALCSLPAFAAEPSRQSCMPTLADVAARMEARYQGEVTAIELDASGDKPAHYHLDMRFPGSGVATLDVDAATLDIASRDQGPLAAGSATLAEAVALLAAQIPGQVTIAELDSGDGASPHYDIDVRLPHGALARLKVDTTTRQIAWRDPAIVTD